MVEAAAPRAFVTGWPVWHSRSPLIHNEWLARYGLAGSYEKIGVPPEEIGEFFSGLRRAGYAGGNVTIPHKEAAFAAVDRRDAAAQAIGAVNTLWFEDGLLVGGNTDAYGFCTNLDERLAGWRDAEEVLVLGAGGAARAIVHAVLAAGAKRVRIVNRNGYRAEEVAGGFGAAVSGHAMIEEPALLQSADLVVNTRPARTAEGEPIDSPDLSPLSDRALVTDIVYVPLETPILQAARARGLKTADGLGMLLHQAAPGFERWFGIAPQVDGVLRHKLLADLEKGA